MKYYFINTGANTGKFNMDYDLELAAHCAPDEMYLRFYTWTPYCLSLGANQTESEIDIDAVTSFGYEVVRRPSGGRAILHAEELTYSVTCHVNPNFSPQFVYGIINEALLKGLSIYDNRLTHAEMETSQPDFREIYSAKNSFACFSNSAKNELKFNSKKLIGSAQKKIGSVVLQHGSILCGPLHKEITKLMKSDSETLNAFKNEIEEKTIDLKSILNEQINFPRLENSIKRGFEEIFKTQFEETSPAFPSQSLLLNEVI